MPFIKTQTFQNVSLKCNKNKRCKKGATTIDMLQIAYASQVLTSFVHGVHRMHKYEFEKILFEKILEKYPPFFRV